MSRFFFIVGAQKSGSTWLQGLLHSHPLISCKGEGHFFDRLGLPMIKAINGYNTLMQTVERTVYEGDGYYKPISSEHIREQMNIWVSGRMLAGPKRSTALLFGDKTPAHSFHLPFIQDIFPEARFIHLIRDGRDVAVSAYFHMKRVIAMDEPPGDMPSWEALASPLLSKWHSFCQPCVNFSKQHPASTVYSIRYEELKADPYSSLAGVLNFLLADSADASRASVERCVERNSFSTRSGRREGSEDHGAFLRKGVVGDWKNHFTPALLASCEPKALNLLTELGYPPL